jgi:hypothetical protein
MAYCVQLSLLSYQYIVLFLESPCLYCLSSIPNCTLYRMSPCYCISTCPLVYRNSLICENQLKPLDTGYLIVSYSRPVLTPSSADALDNYNLLAIA